MKNKLVIAAMFVTAPLFAQETGTSHPEALNDTLTTASPQHYVKPSAAIPMAATSTAPISATTSATAVPSEVALPATSPALRQREVAATETTPLLAGHRIADKALTVNAEDENSGVVMDVPSGPNEFPVSTMLHARLVSEITTAGTTKGSPFQAELTADVLKHGVVLLPAGSMIHGRVTEIHGGKRMAGGAAIRLQPDTITLPDGATYPLEAEVVDLDHFSEANVNREGTIVSSSHPKATLTALGLTTGSAAVAGAVIGGGFGAVIGAGIGAGAGTIWWLKKDRQQTLPQDLSIVFSLDRPLRLAPSSR